MKKLILFLFVCVSFAANAQLARVANPLGANVWFQPLYTGVTADTLGTVTATTWSLAVPVNKIDGLYFVAEIKLADKTTGANGACTVQPQGKYFESGSYVNIGSAVAWTGVGADTTITIASVSAKTYYSYYRLSVTNTSGKSKVVHQKLIFKR